MTNDAECEGGGYLGGMELAIPPETSVRYRGGRDFVGCNRIFCPTCESWVRHVDRRQLGERETDDGGGADDQRGPGVRQRRFARVRVQVQRGGLRQLASHLDARERLVYKASISPTVPALG